MGASSPRPFGRVFGVIVALVGLWTGVAAAAFTTFESGQVRPLALSPDGTRLFAVNTPDDRLEIFSLTGGVPVHTGSVPVGLEPVAVAARSNTEVWVVNHLSDSISIIDVATSPARVTRTLLVCDEPRDLVFAGPGGNRAFVTTARRGQNCTRGGQPHHGGRGARAGAGVRRHQPGHEPRRNAPHHGRAVRRHPARARGLARRRHGLRRRLPLRQPDDRRCRRASSATGAPAPRRAP